MQKLNFSQSSSFSEINIIKQKIEVNKDTLLSTFQIVKKAEKELYNRVDRKIEDIYYKQLSIDYGNNLNQIFIKPDIISQIGDQPDTELQNISDDNWMRVCIKKKSNIDQENLEIKSLIGQIQITPQIQNEAEPVEYNHKVTKEKQILETIDLKLSDDESQSDDQERNKKDSENQFQQENEKKKQQRFSTIKLQEEKLQNINKDNTKRRMTYDFDGQCILINPIKTKNFPPSFYQIQTKLVCDEINQDSTNMENKQEIQIVKNQYQPINEVQIQPFVDNNKFYQNTPNVYEQFGLQFGVKLNTNGQTFQSDQQKESSLKMTREQFINQCQKNQFVQNFQTQETNNHIQSDNKNNIKQNLDQKEFQRIKIKKKIKQGTISVKKEIIDELVINDDFKYEQKQLQSKLKKGQYQSQKQLANLDPVDDFNLITLKTQNWGKEAQNKQNNLDKITPIQKQKQKLTFQRKIKQRFKIYFIKREKIDQHLPRLLI